MYVYECARVYTHRCGHVSMCLCMYVCLSVYRCETPSINLECWAFKFQFVCQCVKEMCCDHQVSPLGPCSGRPPQGKEKLGAVPLAATQHRGPTGPSESWEDATHNHPFPPATQNHTKGLWATALHPIYIKLWNRHYISRQHPLTGGKRDGLQRRPSEGPWEFIWPLLSPATLQCNATARWLSYSSLLKIVCIVSLFQSNLPFYVFVIESVIDCLKFVSSHALGLVMVALSSYDSKLRAAAYQVLACFCQHIEGARFKEKKQVNRLWLYVLLSFIHLLLVSFKQTWYMFSGFCTFSCFILWTQSRMASSNIISGSPLWWPVTSARQPIRCWSLVGIQHIFHHNGSVLP